MAKSIILDLDGIGQVLLERSQRAKRINMSVKPKGKIRVAVPRGTSFKQAEKFVLSNVDWIKRHQEKVKRIELKQKNILSNLLELDRKEAKKKLLSRLNDLARSNGFTYNKVFFRTQKTRWGSCSAKNNINLNFKLARLPDELIDYVILHELVHTKIKNHSKDFWAELNKYVVNAKKMQSRLKEYGLGLL